MTDGGEGARVQPRLGNSVESAVAGGATQTIPITAPVPVYVLNWTAWPASDGHVEYHRDVYGNDARVIAALNN